jgi:hypothetical protein
VVKLVILHPNVPSKKTTPIKKKEKARINLGSLKRKSLLKGTFFIQKRIVATLWTLNKKNMSQIQFKMKNFSWIWSNTNLIKKKQTHKSVKL